MNFNEYQSFALSTAFYPNMGDNKWYPVLGLCGESGEVAEKTKKLYRDHDGNCSSELRQAIAKELGDVLWYVAMTAWEYKIPMEEVVSANVVKLSNRKSKGTLSGNGDDR